MWWGLFRLLMGAAVLGCIAASATFAFEFGWTRGATDTHRWTFALAGVALDLVKSGLPIFGAQAWHERNPARGLACWLVFMVLTGLSLWCAYGTTAIQLASRIATQAVASTTEEDNRAKLKRLRAQRDALTFNEASAEAVEAAQAAVVTAAEQAAAERARGGCKDLCRQREGEERDARAALRKVQENRAATVKAAELDRKIEDAEAAVRASNTVDTKKEADPQSASMARAIGADQDIIAAISHAFFAISIELGSGVGFWLVFGHGRREENAALPRPYPAPPWQRTFPSSIERIRSGPLLARAIENLTALGERDTGPPAAKRLEEGPEFTTYRFIALQGDLEVPAQHGGKVRQGFSGAGDIAAARACSVRTVCQVAR